MDWWDFTDGGMVGLWNVGIWIVGLLDCQLDYQVLEYCCCTKAPMAVLFKPGEQQMKIFGFTVRDPG